MKIKWLGHACFLITSKSGVRILTDPFNREVGYKLPEAEADIVTVSHDHYDHNYVKAVKGRFTVLKTPGAFKENGIGIKGVSTHHDECGGKKRGGNIVFLFDVDGLRVCHCGDLGHLPTGAQVDEIGAVDVLLVPVGGTFTVDSDGAAEVVKQLKPVLAIPMHYKTEAAQMNIAGVEGFLSKLGGKKAGKQEIEIDKASLRSFSGVLALDYK